MKIEMMELLSDNIVDIDLLERVIEALDNMSSNDGMRIFKELKNCDYNVNAYNIAIDEDVLSKRAIEEQIRLMEELKNCDYNENAYDIAIDENVLSERTLEEQIKLMEELKNCDYNVNAYDIAVDEDVLSKRAIEEQIRLMEELKNCDYNYKAYKIAVDEDVLSKRTLEEQIKLMKDMRMGLNQPEKVTHSKNMMKISDVTEFKAYLKELKQKLGKDADVKSDTVVFKFTPDRKKGRKEN